MECRRRHPDRRSRSQVQRGRSNCTGGAEGGERPGDGTAHRRGAESVKGIDRFVVGVVREAVPGIDQRRGCDRFRNARGAAGRAAMRLVAEFAHGNGQLARGEAVQGRHFGGQGAKRSSLHILLLRCLLEVRVVLLEGVVVLAELVEAGGLDQHPGVRPCQAGNGEHTDCCGGYTEVSVVQRNRDLIQATVFVAADKHDVVTLFQLQSVILARKLTATPGSRRQRLGKFGRNGPRSMSFSNRHSGLAFP